jgi:hypothetical protein
VLQQLGGEPEVPGVDVGLRLGHDVATPMQSTGAGDSTGGRPTARRWRSNQPM